MEPQVQYAKTKDGVSIAYWTLGEGPPFVHMGNFPLTHVQLEWQDPDRRRWYERLAEQRMIVRFDHRGTGLSGGDASTFSLDAFTSDLEAVVDDRRLERFALFGYWASGPVAINYAVHHPERLSRLLLWHTLARLSMGLSGPTSDAMAQLAVKDWETFTENVAHRALGWGEGEAAHRFAAFMRRCVSPAAYFAAIAAMGGIDVTDLLPQVNVRTLVLDRRGSSSLSIESATKDLASSIPDARLVLLEGESFAPFLGDTDSVLDAINEFLGEGEALTGEALPRSPGGLVTILFTDVQGSTALTDRLGDAKARDLLREHDRITREALKAHGGSEVKTMGDGFMAAFSAASQALECAISLQRAFAERNASAVEPIKVRIGLSAGEPIAEDDDLFGASVNRAARIAAMARGGEILVANVVRELAEGKEFLFSDRGETALRGFDDPVRLFEVRWREF